MRALLHLVNVLLVLPIAALAAAFLVLGRAISTQSWTGFFGVLLNTFVWLLPWGLLVLVASFVVLVWGGLTTRFYWLASLCVALLAVASTAVVLATVVAHDNFSAEQLMFFVPSLVSAAFGMWLATRDQRRKPSPAA